MTHTVLKAASVIGSATMFSRICGYGRDIFIAMLLGAGIRADAFLIAFRIPNLLRQITAEGALLNAFVPLFTKIENEENADAAHRFAATAAGILLLVLTPFSALCVWFMPEILGVIAGGLQQHPAIFADAVFYSRICFPYIICVSILSLYGGMLNARGIFFPFAFAPVWVNICMIAGACAAWFYDAAEPGLVLSVALPLAGVWQVIWMATHAKRAGLPFLPSIQKRNAYVPILWKRMLPGIFGGGIVQINMWVNTLIATYFAGAVSSLYFADRLLQFPMALIGTAAGIALLPALSTHTAQGDSKAAALLMRRAQEVCLLLALPAAFGLAASSEMIIRVLFERGAFTAEDTAAVVPLLRILCIGLPALILTRIYAPCFYASGDTRTPVMLSVCCLILNAGITLACIAGLGVAALAIGPAVTAWCNTILHVIFLKRRSLPAPSLADIGYMWILLPSSIICGAIAFYTAGYVSHIMPVGAAALISIICGAVGYGVCLIVCQRYRPSRILRMLKGLE